MMTILGAIPYAMVGGILATMGYNLTDLEWQVFAIFGCMWLSELIAWVKHSR
jgi:hypothetical protein